MKCALEVAMEYGEAIIQQYKRLRGTGRPTGQRQLNIGEENLLGVPYGVLVDDVVRDLLGRLQMEDFDAYTRTHRFFQLPEGIALRASTHRAMCIRDFRSMFNVDEAKESDPVTAYAMVRYFDSYIRKAMDEVRMRQAAILAWDEHPIASTSRGTETRSWRERYEDKFNMDSKGRAAVMAEAISRNTAIRQNWEHRDLWLRAYQACAAATALAMQMIEGLALRANVRFAPPPELAAVDKEAASMMQMLYEEKERPSGDEYSKPLTPEGPPTVAPLLTGETRSPGRLTFFRQIIGGMVDDHRNLSLFSRWMSSLSAATKAEVAAATANGQAYRRRGAPDAVINWFSMPVNIGIGQRSEQGRDIYHWHGEAAHGTDAIILRSVASGKPVAMCRLRAERFDPMEGDEALESYLLRINTAGTGVLLEAVNVEAHVVITRIDLDALMEDFLAISGKEHQLRADTYANAMVINAFLAEHLTQHTPAIGFDTDSMRFALRIRYLQEGAAWRALLPPYIGAASRPMGLIDTSMANAIKNPAINRHLAPQRMAGLHLLMQFALAASDADAYAIAYGRLPREDDLWLRRKTRERPVRYTAHCQSIEDLLMPLNMYGYRFDRRALTLTEDPLQLYDRKTSEFKAVRFGDPVIAEDLIDAD
jgi:hypothetical protein